MAEKNYTARYLLDTNILIDYLRGYQPTVAFLEQLLTQENALIFVSAITNLELRLGESITKSSVQKQIAAILSRCYPVEITLETAGRAGDLVREHTISIPDALIAASCIVNDLTLITRNTKHFKNIPNLVVAPFSGT